MLRLFVGFVLPKDARDRLATLAAGLPGAQWTPPENLHVTLRFVGEVDEDAAADIDAALERIKAPAQTLHIEGLGFFEQGRKTVRLWAGVRKTEQLENLKGRIDYAMARAGQTPETRRFQPHVSLARLTDTRRLQDYLDQHGLLRLEVTPDGFALISSQLGRGAPKYRVERDYPFDPVS